MSLHFASYSTELFTICVRQGRTRVQYAPSPHLKFVLSSACKRPAKESGDCRPSGPYTEMKVDVLSDSPGTTNSVATKHGHSRTQDGQPVSTSVTSLPLSLIILQAYTSIVRRFPPSYIHSTHFGHHTEITLQKVPTWKHRLELFVENRQIELETENNQIWIPAQRPYVRYSYHIHLLNSVRIQSYFSDIRDSRGNPSEERPSNAGEEGTGQQTDRHSKGLQ